MDLSESTALALRRPPQPQAVIALEPLLGSRRVEYAILLPGETLAGYFDRIGLALAGRVVLVRINGARVPRSLWRHTRPKIGQLIEVQAVVEGGGGRKVLRSLTQLVVAVAASFLPAPWNFLALYAGNYAINKFLPMPRPNLSDGRGEAVSPTYSLTGAQNRARPYEPLPIVLGTHYIVPDYAAKPYNEFEGEDQYLFAIFHFGLNLLGLDVSDLKVGDTPIASYDDVTQQWSGEDGKITLVAGNVDTIAGGTLTNAAGWITRTSSANATALAIDIEGSLFRSGNEGLESLSATIEAEYRLLPAGAFAGFFQGSVTQATHYWSAGYYNGTPSEATWVQVDWDTINWLNPTAHTENDFAGYPPGQTPDTANVTLIWHWRPYSAVGPNELAPSPLIVVSSTSRTLSNASTKPLRLTYRREVPQGQYEVRVRRTSPDETDDRNTSILQWSVLRTYQPDTGDYTSQKRLALKIKASGQLQGTLDSLNAIARRKVWYWDGAAWQIGVTSNPAWQFYFVARGQSIGGRLVFGMGLADSQIDLDALKAWATFCTSKGLAFDGVADRAMTNAELLDAICAAGWASKTWETGKLGVVWDADNLPITGVVGMGNIVAGSMRVQYVTGGLPDEIVCTFMNAANGYSQEQVRVPAAVASPRRPTTVELYGVTSRTQAGKDANRRWAEVLYRRKTIEWQMDAEGTIARKGDVLALSHDVTQWGYSGRIVSVATGASTVFTLDRRVPAHAAPYIGVRVPGESGYRVLAVSIVGEAPDNDNDDVTLVDPWPVGVGLPGVSRPALDYLYVYDVTPTPGYRVKVLEKVPRMDANGRVIVTLRAVPDVPEFYAAQGGTFGVVAPSTLLDATPVISNLVITEELQRQGTTWYVELTATWDGNAAFASAEVLGGANGAAQVSLGRTEFGRRRFSWRASLDEAWDITVRPYNGVGQAGAPLLGSYTVQGLAVPPPRPDFFTVSRQPDGTREFAWGWTITPKPIDLEGYLIRYKAGTSAAWADMTPFQTDDGFFTASPLESNQLLAGSYVFEIRTRDTSGNVSADGLQVVIDLGDPRQGNVVAQVDCFLLGWPGTKTGCQIIGPYGWLEAIDSTTWDTLPATWDAWTRWNVTPTSPITYQHTTIDLAAVIPVRPIVQAVAQGTLTIEEQHSSDNVTYTAWAAVGSGFTARYVRIRVSVAANGANPVPTLQSCTIFMDGKLEREVLNDINPAALTGSYRIGTGDIRAPITKTYAKIVAVQVTVQNATTNITAIVMDKNTSPGPRIQFRDKADALVDPPLVDIEIEGY